MSSAMTWPVGVTRRAARMVNQPPPAPMSATVEPGGDVEKVHDAIDLEFLRAVGGFEDVEVAGVGGAGGVAGGLGVQGEGCGEQQGGETHWDLDAGLCRSGPRGAYGLLTCC